MTVHVTLIHVLPQAGRAHSNFLALAVGEQPAVVQFGLQASHFHSQTFDNLDRRPSRNFALRYATSDSEVVIPSTKRNHG